MEERAFKEEKPYMKRSLIMFGIFFVMFAFVWYSLKVRCIDDAEKLSVWANDQYVDKVDLSDLNYRLFDKNGKELLKYNYKYHAVIDASSFAKNNLDAKSDDIYVLIYILRNYNQDYDLSNIGLKSSSRKIDYDIDEETYNKLQSIKNVKGFYTYISGNVDRSEAWNLENLITNNRRQLDGSLKDANSLEAQIYNKTKENVPTQMRFERDIDGNISKGVLVEPADSTNVRLTLDKNIEDKVKEVLSNEKYSKLDQVGVIIEEASTGKILAMNQKDDSKPNVNLGSSTLYGFYPGSIFKTVVEEAGLEKKLVKTTDVYTCKLGVMHICKEKVHGNLTVENAYIESCNDVFAEIGDSVIGFKNYIDVAKAQGMFSKVLSFDSEVSGTYVEPIANAGGSRLLSIGQNMLITPVQAISIVNTVVNKGVYVKPQIIEAYVDGNNNIKEALTTESKTVLQRSTANIMKEQMRKVVKEGTGKSADIENIEVGGKTGTTTKHENNKELSDGWFIGYFNVKGKYYSMVVYVKDIDVESESGGTTAAPIFKEVVQSIYSYLQKQ